MTETGVALISEEAVRRELWTSFCSLMRSYLAAAQVGVEAPRALALQTSAESLELVSGKRVVRLTLDAGRAEGYWVMYESAAALDDALLAEGAFRMDMNSRVEWTGMAGPQEMAAVAEALATLMLDDLG